VCLRAICGYGRGKLAHYKTLSGVDKRPDFQHALVPMTRRRKSNSRVTTPISLSARVSLLTPRRREIISPTFEHPREFVLLSVRALAKRLKTDPATMIRIVRGMKFGSYREFQHYLHELSIAHATSLDTMQSGRTRQSTVPAKVRASFEQDSENLKALIQGLDTARLAQFARRLHSAKHIVLLGGDLAANLVKFLEYQLAVLGLPVAAAVLPGEVVHKVRHLGKQDVVLAVSYRRGLRQTIEGLRQAHSQGAYCVGVTDTLVSAINQFAHECFLTRVETPSYGASYVAPIALCNAIVVACANYRPARTLAVIKQMDQEQRHGFRWYEG
jgi:DNA-binding MurR/RpiR family transcriptional regulator